MPRCAWSFFIVVCVVSCSGCAIFPAHVAEPTRDVGSGKVTYERPRAGRAVIPVARNIADLQNQLTAFQETWTAQESQLRVFENAADDLQFASLVWSAYKVATLHLHDARWGAAVAGGIGLFESKYQIDVQAQDYANAANAMAAFPARSASCPIRSGMNFSETVSRR